MERVSWALLGRRAAQDVVPRLAQAYIARARFWRRKLWAATPGARARRWEHAAGWGCEEQPPGTPNKKLAFSRMANSGSIQLAAARRVGGGWRRGGTHTEIAAEASPALASRERASHCRNQVMSAAKRCRSGGGGRLRVTTSAQTRSESSLRMCGAFLGDAAAHPSSCLTTRRLCLYRCPASCLSSFLYYFFFLFFFSSPGAACLGECRCRPMPPVREAVRNRANAFAKLN
ncbi:hypothetical protein HPB50_005883 [Hyalomma asiaticum]|uniref:Uncharacterized protein n=1 Tax=Hyalomma asiaticum TaxID=266040 RepID=A0ACB7S777_HYAAI|nr:hypothetical protein HPB50_005883 [Hyalomma asiaticum]